MGKCEVKNCSNYEGKLLEQKIKFFKFPKDKTLSAKWKKSCCNNNIFNLKTAKICSAHFLDSDYRLQDTLLQTSIEKKRLNPGAVPSCNICLPNVLNTDRQKRQNVRERKSIIREVLELNDKYIIKKLIKYDMLTFSIIDLAKMNLYWRKKASEMTKML